MNRTYSVLFLVTCILAVLPGCHKGVEYMWVVTFPKTAEYPPRPAEAATLRYLATIRSVVTMRDKRDSSNIRIEISDYKSQKVLFARELTASGALSRSRTVWHSADELEVILDDATTTNVFWLKLAKDMEGNFVEKKE